MKLSAQPLLLPKRLPAIYDLIPPEVETVADIGYDHGKLIRKLVITRPHVRVIGVELLPHYAEAFWRRNRFRDIAEARRRIDLRTGTGLAPLAAGEAVCLVLAGMGETNITGILSAFPHKISAIRHLVLAPSHYFIKLRGDLAELGFYAAREQLAFERGRYYLVVHAVPGTDPARGELTWHFAPRLFEQKHAHLYAYLQHQKKLLTRRNRFREQQHPAIRTYLQHLDEAIRQAALFAGAEHR